MKTNISLQINLAPNDYKHALLLLPHQLKTLAGQVDEIMLTLDTNRSKGRFGQNWEENLGHIQELISRIKLEDPKIKCLEVDYSPATMQKVAQFFFGQPAMPTKDYRGGPFYAYFYGLYSSSADLVFHLDSDMFLGGRSKTWITEAVALLGERPEVLTCSPLPGPPHPDHKLIGQPDPVALGAHQFVFKGMSTRIFMINKAFFEKKKVILKKTGIINRLKALIRKQPPYALPEQLLGEYMHAHRLKRIDFLGQGAGLWSLHPPYRTRGFYQSLPGIISRVENNELPASQLGFYDLVDEVCDWTEAREKLRKNRWWK